MELSESRKGLAAALLAAAFACGGDAVSPTEAPPGAPARSEPPKQEAPAEPRCAALQQEWLAGRAPRALAGQPSAFATVGDCWVAAGDVPRARSFFRDVLASRPRAQCDEEGGACDLLAAEELRRLDCGFDWLATSAEGAWRGFLAGLDDFAAHGFSPDGPPLLALHLLPDTRSGVWQGDPLSERCTAQAFAVPTGIVAARAVLRARVLGAELPWSERTATVSFSEGDVPWKNFAPHVYSHIAAIVCPYPRATPPSHRGRYAVELIPVSGPDEMPRCREQSRLTWTRGVGSPRFAGALR